MNRNKTYRSRRPGEIRIAAIGFITILSFFAFPLIAKPLYQFKDANGNLVFSDKLPQTQNFKEVSLQNINVTQWEVVKPKKSKTSGHSKRKKARRNSKNDTKTNGLSACSQLREKIQQLDSKLKHRLEASEFDQTKRKLSKLRWKYQKAC